MPRLLLVSRRVLARTLFVTSILLALNVVTTEARKGIRPMLDTEGLPEYLRDRGTGVPASQFGTYVQNRMFIIYPFFEYYRDSNAEYAPNELGGTEDIDYRGKYEATEYLLYLAYGVAPWLMVEFEAAYIDATLDTSPDDPSGLPPTISESGLGDVEGQVRWRWRQETLGGPEVFSYFETVFPTADEGALIGTSDWEFKLGVGVIKGLTWGTWTARLAVEYDKAEEAFAMGEAAIEYLKRLSSKWRVFGAVEGNEDEVELIGEAQWHFSDFALLKLNSAVGLTSKATDWAPEVGVMFYF